MKYNSVIFDMDGVILDFEGEDFQWQNKAVREVLKNHGMKNPEELSRSDFEKFLGVGGVKECAEICNEYGLDAGTVWEAVAEETTKARAKKMNKGDFKLFPDVEEVLNELHQRDILLGLVSNAPEMAIMQTMKYYDLKRFFKFYRGIESFDDLSDRKPHPDHLNFARAELKRDPFIFVGDSESDILAAQNADMDSVWVNRNNSSIDVRPDYEVEQLGELLEIFNIGKSQKA